jgi:hypothetical protein
LKDRSEIHLNYKPTAKQNQFHSCGADVTLYGGAAGGGKSIALLMDALISVIEVPGNTAMLMRRTYPELEASLIKKSLELFPREIAKFNDAKHRWSIDTGSGISYIIFGHCEREKDAYDYRSSEWGYLGIDEATSFTQFMFDMLYSRVRSPIKGAHPRARLCSNPGLVGHGWIKKYFRIGNKPPNEIWRPPIEEGMTVLPPSRCFIPASVKDNTYLMEADPAYIGRLEALPEQQRKMLLYGDWDGFTGQYFTEFEKTKHVIKPFDIPRNWKLYRSVDFGFSKPFSCHWHAVADNGHCYTFREAYKTGLRDKEQAKVIKSMSVRKNKDGSTEEEVYEFTVGDPAMARKSADTGISVQMNYDAHGVTIFPGSNARIPGWMAMRNWMSIDPNTGTPWWQIFDTCPELIRELEEAIYDEAPRQEDLNTDGSDHALDDCRYFFMARPSPGNPLPKNDPRAKLDASSQREWEAVDKMTVEMSNRSKPKSVLNGFNDS